MIILVGSRTHLNDRAYQIGGLPLDPFLVTAAPFFLRMDPEHQFRDANAEGNPEGNTVESRELLVTVGEKEEELELHIYATTFVRPLPIQGLMGRMGSRDCVWN